MSTRARARILHHDMVRDCPRRSRRNSHHDNRHLIFLYTTWINSSHLARRLLFLFVTLPITSSPTFYICWVLVLICGVVLLSYSVIQLSYSSHGRHEDPLEICSGHEKRDLTEKEALAREIQECKTKSVSAMSLLISESL